MLNYNLDIKAEVIEPPVACTKYISMFSAWTILSDILVIFSASVPIIKSAVKLYHLITHGCVLGLTICERLNPFRSKWSRYITM